MKLKNNISFDGIIKSFEEKYGRKYTENQLKQLRLGYEHNVNILIYSHPQFSGFEMQEIRLGLMSKVDVSVYANSEFSDDQMEEIRRGLDSGIDVSKYSFPYLASPVMRQKRERLEYEQMLNA